MLIEHHVANQELIWIDKYINPLKSLIGEDQLLVYCKSLIKKIEKGKKVEILALFEIFGRNLNLLKIEEQDMALTYMYNVAHEISPWGNSKFKVNGLFTFLGLYMESPLQKTLFFNLLLKIIRNHNSAKNSKWTYLSIYKDMISNFSKDKIEKCQNYVTEQLPEPIVTNFFNALDNDDDLPF